MANEDQLDIRTMADGRLELEFEYNADFIAWLKQRIPHMERSYDEDTHIWTVPGSYLNAIVGIGTQKFQFATHRYRNEKDEMVWRNLKTGRETVQGGLF